MAVQSVKNECSVISLATPLVSTAELRRLVAKAVAEERPYILLTLSNGQLGLSDEGMQRMRDVLKDQDVPMVYADYQAADGTPHPLIDYQEGSVRDDFDFGKLIMLRTDLVSSAIEDCTPDYTYAGWYQLRLAMSRESLPVHINEVLYTFTPMTQEESSQFDYLDPSNRLVQQEYEAVFTEHLKAVDGFINHEPLLTASQYEYLSDVPDEVVATVVIPVYNRERTIEDAVRSAMSQVTDFTFNVIVVDNHSTDATSEILERLVAEFSKDQTGARLYHLCPKENDLKIGGCWNLAVASRHCGRYVVQLDSDDLYAAPDVLQRIVDAFDEQDCVVVVGSYDLTDFDLNPLPPGLIDHREWTPENGMNNALRVNGFGAPRAFRRDVLELNNFPNTSYGEDYAVMLRLSREYRIGRIYDSLYHCRRWSGNSDAALSLESANRNNYDKDEIRTLELQARQIFNLLMSFKDADLDDVDLDDVDLDDYDDFDLDAADFDDDNED